MIGCTISEEESRIVKEDSIRLGEMSVFLWEIK